MNLPSTDVLCCAFGAVTFQESAVGQIILSVAVHASWLRKAFSILGKDER